MARSIVARRQGDDFQARLFWLHATSLLDPHSPVVRVVYETGPKGFDDITVEYDPKAAPQDHGGKPIDRRHMQCKWHTRGGVFGYEDLADPAFIGAERFSLLDKAYEAQTQYAPDGFGCRFELVTNWHPRPDDPLLELIRKESGALDLDRLFDGTGDGSRMGRVRKLWCGHLGLDHGSLELALSTLAILEAPESSLANLRERLDDRFAAFGMKRVPPSEAAFFYDDLAAKLLAQRRVAFDRDTFRQMARRENLLVSPSAPARALTIGIRSFMHPIDPLDQRCQRMLNLVPHFDGRYIRKEADWHDQVLPELRQFVLNAARSSDRLRLVLDAHVSLAFAVGALLNVKSGKRIEVEQRTGGRRLWSMDDLPADPGWPRFEFGDEVFDGHGDELALAIGLTHDVSAGARTFISEHAVGIGRILHCRPRGGASQQSVLCGRHAWMLAEAAVQQVRRLREGAPAAGRLHVFIAAPNGFAFFLGQHQQALGSAAVYEWDFEGQRGTGYSPALVIGDQGP